MLIEMPASRVEETVSQASHQLLVGLAAAYQDTASVSGGRASQVALPAAHARITVDLPASRQINIPLSASKT